MFRDRFWLSVLFTIPVLVWSPMIQDWLGFDAPSFPGSERIPFLLGTVVFVYGGTPFLRGGLREIRDRQPGMMLLISLAIVVAYASSVASDARRGSTWSSGGSSPLLIDVMLLGHWQEMKAIGPGLTVPSTPSPRCCPTTPSVIDGEVVRRSPPSDLRVGDLVLVRPGGRVPADGTDRRRRSGVRRVDDHRRVPAGRPQAPATGSWPGRSPPTRPPGAGRPRVGDDTALAGIQRLVAEAQASASRAQALADRAAALLFYVAIGAGVVTFVVWSAARRLGRGGRPHRHRAGDRLPARARPRHPARDRDLHRDRRPAPGILVKDRLALERMRTVDAVLFDKTGTLTHGEPRRHRRRRRRRRRATSVLALAAAAEADSEHPLARAIVEAARAAGRHAARRPASDR